MKKLNEALEDHYRKAAINLNTLQFHFYETHIIVGRKLFKQRALANMAQTHKRAMGLLSTIEELRAASQESPLTAFVLTPRFYSESRIFILPEEKGKVTINVPWGVKITLPRQSLHKLNEAKTEASLYTASANEMSEWLDWFQNEDKAITLTNQICLELKTQTTKAAFEVNLRKVAWPVYQQTVSDFYMNNKQKTTTKTLVTTDFAPKRETNLAEAYKLISGSIANHRNRHFEDFQHFWRDRLLKLMFENVDCNIDCREIFIKTYFGPNDKADHSKMGFRY